MKRRTIATEFWIGDVVHHAMADDDQPGIITAVQINPCGSILHRVSWRGRSETWSYPTELRSERPSPIPEPPRNDADAV